MAGLLLVSSVASLALPGTVGGPVAELHTGQRNSRSGQEFVRRMPLLISGNPY
jgi:hypothetical protein